MIVVAAPDGGAGTGLLVLMLGVVFLLLGAAAIVVLVRRRRVPLQSVPAGPEVVSTYPGRNGTARPKPEPRRGKEWWPSFPKPMRTRAGRKEQQRQSGGTAADPRLTAAVVLEAASYQAVYHGGRSAGRFKVAVRAATARGRSHAYEGTPGQDVAGVAWNEQRRSVFAVVADGLGSKIDSGLVAREIVDLTLNWAEDLAPAGDPVAMIHEVIHNVGRMTKQRALDGATTLVVAEIRADADGVVVTTWGVGDSEAWLLESGDWRPLHHERRPDAENVTRHLPGHTDVLTARARVRQGSVVTLASDGFASALGSNSRVARDLVGEWRTPPAPTDFLRQVNFEDRYFNDDRAAVAVWIR
jgi:serine/threonine protein phosphatase PrpC